MELKAVRKSQPLHGTGPEADSLRGEGAVRSLAEIERWPRCLGGWTA